MAEQMTNVLVPVDFSEHSDTALDYATMLAQRVGGSIELLHVVEDPFASGCLERRSVHATSPSSWTRSRPMHAYGWMPSNRPQRAKASP
jgi:nucleotide-binding universal stress UspA family protein